MKFKKLHPEAKCPYKKDPEDAGYDLYAIEDVIIPSVWYLFWKLIYKRVCQCVDGYKIDDELNLEDLYSATKVKTGIALQIPNDQYGKIFDRSGMGSKLYLTSAGVIDSTYRGEIMICVYNLSFKDYQVRKGDRVAQIVFHEYKNHEFEEDELTESERAESGFGASGR